MKIFITPIQVGTGAYISYYKIIAPTFCCFLFFKECLNTQVRINEIVNKHTLDNHPSPSELALWIHPLIFLRTSEGFISPEYFLNFFQNLYIIAWLQKSFKFMLLRLLENTFLNQKIETVHFYSCL